MTIIPGDLPDDTWIASGQMAAGEPPKPDRRNVNCRNCGSSIYKIEIVDYAVIATCAHCGTTEVIFEG